MVSFYPEHVMFPFVLSEKAPWFSPEQLAKQKFKVTTAASGPPAAGNESPQPSPQESPADFISYMQGAHGSLVSGMLTQGGVNALERRHVRPNVSHTMSKLWTVPPTDTCLALELGPNSVFAVRPQLKRELGTTENKSFY